MKFATLLDGKSRSPNKIFGRPTSLGCGSTLEDDSGRDRCVTRLDMRFFNHQKGTGEVRRLEGARCVLRVLGGWRLEIDGELAVGPGYRKARSLLTVLVLQEGWHTRSSLADLLAVNGTYFRQLVANLRSTLDLRDAMGIELDGGRLRLHPDYPLACDAITLMEPGGRTLEQIQERIGGYGGPFLADVALQGSPALAEWVQAQRHRYLRQLLLLLDQARILSEADGHDEQALDFMRLWTRHCPEDGVGHQHLIRLMMRTGYRADARAQLANWQQASVAHPAGQVLPGERARLQFLAGPVAALPTAPSANFAFRHRRLLTVLIGRCLAPVPSGDDDLERHAEISRLLQSRFETAVRAAGGLVPPGQGHLPLACFGLPPAPEHAVSDAVRVASGMLRYEGALELPFGWTIHSAHALVDPQEIAPDTAGVVSRQALALAMRHHAAELVLSPDSAALVRGRFVLEPVSLDPLGVGEMVGSVTAFRVLKESGLMQRLRAQALSGSVCGRQAERSELIDLWEEALSHRRPSLLLRGAPGLGKSRLVHELALSLGGHGEGAACANAVILPVQCRPEWAQTPFAPVLEALTEHLHLDPHLAPQQRRLKLAELLSARTDPALEPRDQALRLMCELMGFGDLPPAIDAFHAVAQRREMVHAALLALFDAVGGSRPMLVIIEDIHWADPSTLGFIAKYVGQEHGAPCLTLITARPEVDWRGAEATLDLEPLAPGDVATLARQVNPGLSDEAVAWVIEMAEGVPFYAEELARVADQSITRPPEARLQMPMSLSSMMQGFVDRAEAARPTLAAASVIGARFSEEGLSALLNQDPGAVRAHLIQLQEGGLILAQESSHTPNLWRFKHALLQEAAYQALLPGQRVDLHLRMVDWLRDQADQAPELLAHHLMGAHRWLEAAWQLLQCGKRAAWQSAAQEAEALFARGLALIERVDPSLEAQRCAMAFWVALGMLEVGRHGYGSEQAGLCFGRAQSIFEHSPQLDAGFPVFYGLWSAAGGPNQRSMAQLDVAHRLLDIARKSGQAEQVLMAHYAAGTSLMWLARYDEAHQHLCLALAAGAGVPDSMTVERCDEATHSMAESYAAWTLLHLGRPDQALAQIRQALQRVRLTRHAHSHGQVLAVATVICRELELVEEVARLCDELFDVLHKADLALWRAAAEATAGWVKAASGDASGLEEIAGGCALAAVAMPAIEAIFHTLWVDAELRLGRWGEAQAQVEVALSMAHACSDYCLLPELLRLQARALRGGLDAEPARVCALLDQAMRSAEADGAHLQALRCAMDRVDLLDALARRGDGAAENDLATHAWASLVRCRARCAEGALLPALRRADARLAVGPNRTWPALPSHFT